MAGLVLMLRAHVSVGDSGYRGGEEGRGIFARSTDSGVDPLDLESWRGCLNSRLEEDLY